MPSQSSNERMVKPGGGYGIAFLDQVGRFHTHADENKDGQVDQKGLLALNARGPKRVI